MVLFGQNCIEIRHGEIWHSIIWSSPLSGWPGVPVEAWVGMVAASLTTKPQVGGGLAESLRLTVGRVILASVF